MGSSSGTSLHRLTVPITTSLPCIQGNYIFLGAGTIVLIGTSIIDISGIGTWMGNGNYISVGGEENKDSMVKQIYTLFSLILPLLHNIPCSHPEPACLSFSLFVGLIQPVWLSFTAATSLESQE